MTRIEFTGQILRAVNEKLQAYFGAAALEEVVSVDWVQEVAVDLAKEVSRSVFAGWAELLEKLTQEMRTCPRCGHLRKVKQRASEPIRIDVLGFTFELPKPYLECGYCDAPGVSVIKLLTGLQGGGASLELKLMAGYCASQHSYQKASRDLKVHYGQDMERTKVRRMTLEVEREALAFAERTRQQSLGRVIREGRAQGPPVLILEADGGKVRTGELVACAPEDRGFGKVSPKRGKPCRKRPTSFRELITMDVREPGALEASALDVLVPVLADEGERGRRMLALAARQGLGDNTFVQGLGDMGSELATSFDEAFVAYPHHWSTDWTHTRGYVDAVTEVLQSKDPAEWGRQMRSAIWERDEKKRDELLQKAERRRVRKLPAGVEKCPVKKLRSYLSNNWAHMEFARLQREGLPFVSARAESQVRDLTKDRFCVAGAWREENLEPKAVLRTIIAEGRWGKFRSELLEKSKSIFEQDLRERLERALREGRLTREQVSRLTGEEQRTAA